MKRSIFTVLLLVVSSCGVPSTGNVIGLAESELPPELSEVTTTTTSTSTTIVADEAPQDRTASLTEVLSEPVELYYISANRLVVTTLTIASPATTSQVLAALISGPPSGDNGVGLRSALPVDLNAEIQISKGIAQIDTSSQFLSDLSPIDQRLAIAQIVLTFTRRPGVGQVIFTVDGETVAVPRGRGDLAKPGSAVSFDDYSSLIVTVAG